MSKSIQISDSTFEKMKKAAVPLEDNPDSLLDRVLDFYLKHHDDGSKSGSTEDKDILMLDPHAPDDLRHSKIRWGRLGGRRISGRNWSQLVETAHELATERSQSFEEVRRITPFNVREGKYEERGYHHFPSAGLSVQYKSAPDVWDGCLKIAEDLGVPVEVEFEWLNKEGASHPGKKGKLSWAPEENGRPGAI